MRTRPFGLFYRRLALFLGLMSFAPHSLGVISVAPKTVADATSTKYTFALIVSSVRPETGDDDRLLTGEALNTAVRDTLEMKIDGGNTIKIDDSNTGGTFSDKFLAKVTNAEQKRISNSDNVKLTAIVTIRNKTANSRALEEALGSDARFELEIEYADVGPEEITIRVRECCPASEPKLVRVFEAFQTVGAQVEFPSEINYENADGDISSDNPPGVYFALIPIAANLQLRGLPLTSSSGDETVGCNVVTDSADSRLCRVVCQPQGTYSLQRPSGSGGIGVADADSEGRASFSRLEVSGDGEANYRLVVNYDRGTKAACFNVQPSDNITFTEFTTGNKPRLGDPRCFVATAAYGSPLDPHLDSLRWLRDAVLLQVPGGAWLVEGYYRYSPPLAAVIAHNDSLRAGVRLMLWPVVGVLELLRQAGLWTLLILLLAGLAVVSLRMRRVRV